MRYDVYVETEIAKIVHKRFAIVGLFYLVLSMLSGYVLAIPPEKTVSFWQEGWTIFLIGCVLELLFTLGVAKKFNFQNISMRLRSGNVIKLSFWLTIVLTIFAGLASYYIFLELELNFWPMLAGFVLLLITLFVTMSVRYAIDEEVKKSKVCEFC